MKRLSQVMLAAALARPVEAAELPRGIARQLPPGYQVLSAPSASFDGPARRIYLVALAKQAEAAPAHASSSAPARPLLLFKRQPNGSFRQIGRNDTVIMRADEGGQCDPFKDSGGVIAVTGRYFTVENGVACGQHWTDYITFRFDSALGRYVFDNERLQSWSLNSSDDPDAEALVPDGPPTVRRAEPGTLTAFQDWRPSR